MILLIQPADNQAGCKIFKKRFRERHVLPLPVCHFSSQMRKSSTRERLTVISNETEGVGIILNLPPACFIMLVMAFMEIMHPREMRKNSLGSSSSLITSSEESSMYLCSSDVTR